LTQSAFGVDRFDARDEGRPNAMRLALADSGITAEDVACIVASASGSRAGDHMEQRALEQVFQRQLRDLPVCAPKAAFGEAMGASGALCALTAGLALQERRLPPTPGMTSTAAPVRGDYALVNAFSCDGNNASLVVRVWNN
jgi:minimal PKS chain-length factor (CLF/KS beta)